MPFNVLGRMCATLLYSKSLYSWLTYLCNLSTCHRDGDGSLQNRILGLFRVLELERKYGWKWKDEKLSCE